MGDSERLSQPCSHFARLCHPSGRWSTRDSVGGKDSCSASGDFSNHVHAGETGVSVSCWSQREKCEPLGCTPRLGLAETVSRLPGNHHHHALDAGSVSFKQIGHCFPAPGFCPALVELRISMSVSSQDSVPPAPALMLNMRLSPAS